MSTPKNPENEPQPGEDQAPLDASIENPTTGAVPVADDDAVEHPSDYPGKNYPSEGSPERDTFSSQAERSHSSGTSNPSEPRRPGMGERQAPLREGPGITETTAIVPGEILMGDGDVTINAGLEVTTIRVQNVSDRPIQVGSHFHFAEVNAALDFDRDAAWGKRLNVLSGGAVRFEPGAMAEVELVPIRGKRIVRGLRGLSGGALDG